MKKISINNLIKFRRKSEKSKYTFIKNLSEKDNNINLDEDPRDYWITSTSALNNTFKSGKKDFIIDKIYDLVQRRDNNTKKTSKLMYDRNIQILHNFEDFNFSKIKPDTELHFLTKPHDKAIITINQIPVYIKPTQVFVFNQNKKKKIGAIWFASILEGMNQEEIGIFTKSLYKYLKTHYSTEYEISTDYCIAIDVFNLIQVNYTDIKTNKVSSLLESTLENLKKFVK